MVTLSEDALRLVLRRAYEFDWDEVDVERELARRRFLRSAALVARSWSGPAQEVLGETVIARELDDLYTVDRAVHRGALRLEGVRTLVLDESVSREVDADAFLWDEIDDAFREMGRRPPRRGDDHLPDAYEDRKDPCRTQALRAFSIVAHALVVRLPALR